jgi:hypothetical protein
METWWARDPTEEEPKIDPVQAVYDGMNGLASGMSGVSRALENYSRSLRDAWSASYEEVAKTFRTNTNTSSRRTYCDPIYHTTVGGRTVGKNNHYFNGYYVDSVVYDEFTDGIPRVVGDLEAVEIPSKLGEDYDELKSLIPSVPDPMKFKVEGVVTGYERRRLEEMSREPVYPRPFK